MRWTLLAVATASAAFAATPMECRQKQLRGRNAEARACFVEMTRSPRAWTRAEGHWGLREYREANNQFRLASGEEPQNPDVKVRWGRLFIEPFNKNKQDAANLFGEALAIDKKHAGALLGMALVASDGFESKAAGMARQALESDPKLVEAQELLASLALEDADPRKAAEEAGKALAISGEALDALAITAAASIVEDKPATEWLDRIYKINPNYGEAHAIIAHHLVLNRRYEEAIAHYRRALDLDPEHDAARSQLGINLMRLGREAEARRLLEEAFQRGFRESATVNSLRLIDSFKNFVTYKTDNTILKLHKKESAQLRAYFEDELKRSIAAYEKKYRHKLAGPVQLEVYPDHEDFAVRTMGMPGLGALGVTFGDVVAMDSPSGRKPGTFHWASTLWHELSHVFVLSATKHRVPRWFTEGVAVHEETAEHPDWGDRLTPEIILAVKDNKLLPVAELDRGFIRPSYPAQVVVSYFQAGRICDYIQQKWGWEKILEMMHAFARRRSTPDVIQEQLGLKPEQFDTQFRAWLDQSVSKTAKGFEEWRKRVRTLAGLAKEQKHDEVLREAPEVVALYPDYVEAANAYEFWAEALLARNDKKKAAEVLGNWARTGGRHPDTLKKLSALQAELGDSRAAAQTLEKINYIYPVNDEALHRKLGDLYLAQRNLPGAIREYGTVVAANPLDPAAAHYNLARAYQSAGRAAQAEDHVLAALEAAPSYRPAQKLLLELNAVKKEKP